MHMAYCVGVQISKFVQVCKSVRAHRGQRRALIGCATLSLSELFS